MASIINTSINLNNIDKDKIIVGKKGKYLPISITINDDVDQFVNQNYEFYEKFHYWTFYKLKQTY